jgi:hypothetical protein
MAASARKPLTQGMWWLLFAAATYMASLGFQTFKTFTLVPSLTNGLVWLGVLLILGLLVGILAYDSYAQERLRGQVQRPVRLFDRLMERNFLMSQSLRKGENV